jgi:hypothetical protein
MKLWADPDASNTRHAVEKRHPEKRKYWVPTFVGMMVKVAMMELKTITSWVPIYQTLVMPLKNGTQKKESTGSRLSSG